MVWPVRWRGLKDQWTATANNNKMATRVTRNVPLDAGDELRLEFYTNGNMRCRTDYIDIAPSSGSSGIESIEGPALQQVHIYSLDGRYLGSDIGRLGKGIYIINNRKVVISGR